jgi:integrative and conjugative element protein (TIGR02256 family)
VQATVWIVLDVLGHCRRLGEEAFPRETGGVLMGWHNETRQEVVVVHAVGPGPMGMHGSHRFEPDNDYHLVAVADVYQRSGRTVTYLGDWHTHPNGSTSLSRRDKTTLGGIATHGPSRCPSPLMVVLAGNPEDGWHAAAHTWAPRRVLLWERADSAALPLRQWTPRPGELDVIAYPYSPPE